MYLLISPRSDSYFCNRQHANSTILDQNQIIEHVVQKLDDKIEKIVTGGKDIETDSNKIGILASNTNLQKQVEAKDKIKDLITGIVKSDEILNFDNTKIDTPQFLSCIFVIPWGKVVSVGGKSFKIVRGEVWKMSRYFQKIKRVVDVVKPIVKPVTGLCLKSVEIEGGMKEGRGERGWWDMVMGFGSVEVRAGCDDIVRIIDNKANHNNNSL